MRKIRVLVVEDSPVMRRAIMLTLAKDASLEVVGAAKHGQEALTLLPELKPDLVTLDIEMPVMDGLATLREIRKLQPNLPVIMFSSLTQRGAVSTVLALTIGATDCVAKPANMSNLSESWQCLEEELLPKVKFYGENVMLRAERPARPVVQQECSPATVPTLRRRPVHALCIGVSTGGPNALVRIFSQVPDPLPVPVLIVQHMPAMFTRMLAERLTSVAQMEFHEAVEGMEALPGHGYLAPGGKHMTVVQDNGVARLHLNEDPPENSCRPAVDVLFRSAAAAVGPNLLVAVLTGMGKDGTRGSEMVKARGGRVLVQDEATSVVWGMPGQVWEAGFSDRMLPLDQMAGEFIRYSQVGR
jgi:two-component system chemotaxis response regulator CheB